MSHATLEGIDTLDSLATRFAPEPRGEAAVVKYGALFVSTDGNEWLIDTVTVDRGGAHQGSQHFYIRVKLKDGRLTVRLDQLTDPFKSPGVHESIAAIARWLVKTVPGSAITNHGLGACL